MSEPAAFCMSAEERTGWDFWDERILHPTRLPCADCTPEYAAEMTEAGLCNGSPVVRYCDHCKRWTPLTATYWVVTTKAAGATFDKLGRQYVRRRSSTSYICRGCRRRQQVFRWHRGQGQVSDEVRLERRRASWRKYGEKRSARLKAERAAR